MAKKQISNINVTGMSIQDITRLTPDKLNKLNATDLKKISSRLVSASNKRIRRLKSKELNTPSLQNIARGQEFSIKGKTRNQVLNTFKQMKNFLTAKTSTISGARKVQKEFVERIGLNQPMNKTQTKKFWKVYDKLVTQNGGIIKQMKSSDQLQSYLASMIKSKSRISQKELMSRLNKRLDELYTQYVDENDIASQFDEETNDDEFDF